MGISGTAKELSPSQKLCCMELVISSHADTFLTLLDSEDEGSTIIQNASNHFPIRLQHISNNLPVETV